MVIVKDLREGMLIEIDGVLYQVIGYEHIKLARRGAFCRIKLKDFKKQSVIEKSFPPDQKIKLIKLYPKKATFLYKDNDFYYFLEDQTYQEVLLHKDILGEGIKFLVENLEVDILYKEDEEIVGIELPETVELEIVETEPGFKGDTVSMATKPAKLQNGVVIQVPLFIEVGDKIKVNTKTGEYVERA